MGGDQAHQTIDYKGDNENDKQFGQLGVEELLAVGNLVVQHFGEEPAFLEYSPSQGQNKSRG